MPCAGAMLRGLRESGGLGKGGGVLLLHSVNKSESHSRTITTDVHKMKIQFAFILTILVFRKNSACLYLNFWK
jgi:hypothetical protein